MQLPTMLSIDNVADILSLSKRVITQWIDKGLLDVCADTNLIHVDGLKSFAEFKDLIESKWDAEEKITPLRDYSLIELFAGCGGMALGMEQAGLKGVLYNEIDKHACSTLRHNRPQWNVVEGDIHNVDFQPYAGQIDVLTGGFPCQAFSYAGKSLGFEDVRGTLFFEMARAIKETQPKLFLAENVRALSSHDDGKTIATIKNIIQEIGYTVVEPKLMKAMFYKVPQKRERLIIIGIRNDLKDKIDFQFPSKYTRLMTLKDALYKGDLYDKDVPQSAGQIYPNRKREIMSHVPQGGYWRDLPLEMQKEYMMKSFYLGGGKTGVARRLSLNSPSLTLTTSPAQKQTERCHPIETRPLTVREYARIQTFVDDWEFKGSSNSAYKQIGNAVPVNLAVALGRSIVRSLNDLEENI